MSREPSLKSLRAFEAVARLGSVTRAGNELSVTPGAISRRIKELEIDCGISVLERHGRGVRLTPEGSRLKNSLCPAFDMINKAISHMRCNSRRSRLVVSAEPIFAMSWLLPRLNLFRRENPKLEIIITNRFDERTIANPDIIIDWGILEDSASSEMLTQELIIPVCSPSVSPNRTLSGITLVHRHEMPKYYCFPDWATFLEAVGVRVIDPHEGIKVDEGLVLEAAREGIGVILASSTIAYDDLCSGRLVRPIEEAMEWSFGYTLSIDESIRDRTEVGSFRGWLLEEIARSSIAKQPLESGSACSEQTAMRDPNVTSATVRLGPGGGGGVSNAPM